MNRYGTVLIAIDLSDESGIILERARQVTPSGAACHVVYVQEPMEAVYMGVVPYGPVFVGMDQVEDRLQRTLKTKLEEIASSSGIDDANIHFLSGVPAREIQTLADEIDADLIVLGTHGQKGVQLLLGSTANSVLHGAGCDVLTVRIQREP